MLATFTPANPTHRPKIKPWLTQDYVAAWIHGYEKADFKIVSEFIVPWHPVPHWLMRYRRTEDGLGVGANTFP